MKRLAYVLLLSTCLTAPAAADPITDSIILAATVASSTLGPTVTSFIASTVVTGVLAAANYLLSQPEKQKINGSQYQVKQALPSLLMCMGETKLGGAKFVFENANGYYIDGLVHCCGPIDSFRTWMLGDKFTTIAPGSLGGPSGLAPYGGQIHIESHLGESDQAASPTLLTRLSGVWTDNHRLAGLAYSVLQAEPVKKDKMSKVFPNGVPALYVIVRGAKVFDPRDTSQDWNNPGTWKWSSNSALLSLWHLTAFRGTDAITGKPVPVGYGLPHNRIDLPTFVSMANLCDQQVAKRDGSTESRYTCDGTFDLAKDTRRDVQGRILVTCDGELYQTGSGKLALRGGQWTTATVTLSDACIIGAKVESDTGRLAAFNRLKITFTDRFNDYQQLEADPWDDVDNQTLIAEVLESDFSVPFVQSHSMARRLAKIAMAKGNPRWKVTLTTNLAGLLAFDERIIHLDYQGLGIAGDFLVTSFVENGDGATCKIGLSSFGPEAYDFDPLTEEGIAPAVAIDTTAALEIEDPEGIAVFVDRTTIGGTVSGLTLRATVAAPVNGTLTLLGRYRVAGGGDDDWVDMGADGVNSVVSGQVDDGGSYDVEVQFEAPYGGAQSAWVSGGTITATADTSPPDPPSSLGAAVSGSGATITWHNPGNANFRSTQIYRSSDTDFSHAAAVGAAVNGSSNATGSKADTGLAAGSYSYWAVALNYSGAASDPTGPVTVTVT